METVRAAFREGVRAYVSSKPRPAEPRATLDGAELPLGELAGIAAGLHQAMPECLCDALGLAVGTTYSQGARRLQELLKREALAGAES